MSKAQYIGNHYSVNTTFHAPAVHLKRLKNLIIKMKMVFKE